jgi:hypothetical protein
MDPFKIPDPHSIHIEVSAKATKKEVEEAIENALNSKRFTDLIPLPTDTLLIHIKFGGKSSKE